MKLALFLTAIAIVGAGCSRSNRDANRSKPSTSVTPPASAMASAIATAEAPPLTTNVRSWAFVGPPRHPVRDYRAVARGKNLFVVVGDAGSVVTSPDGATWTLRDIGATKQLSVAAYAEGKFFVAGGGEFFSSTDGIVWTKANVPGPVIDIASIPGKIVIASRGASFSSSDGGTWARHPAPDFSADRLVANASGLFVAVGAAAGRSEKDRDVIAFTSSDGAKWSKKVIAEAKGETARSLVWAIDAFWMATASGRIFRSADGLTWSKTADVKLGADETGAALAYGSGMFVLASRAMHRGSIFSSPDGRTWQDPDAYVGTEMNAMVFGDGIFVIAAEGNGIAASARMK